MKITLDLATVPVFCWWWTGLTVYLLLCYLWWGPALARHIWRWEKVHHLYLPDPAEAYLAWLFSPVAVPSYILYRTVGPVFSWIIWRGEK